MTELTVGIDIGGTRTKLGLVNLVDGSVIEQRIVPTETSDEEQFISSIHKVVQEFESIAAKKGDALKGIGFGIPGFVFENGVIDTTYGFIDFMEDYPLKNIIESRMNIPCKLDNDARVVALGEALFGLGKGYNRVLVLTLGTGLGVGFTVKGKLNEPQPFAHMAGHMRIVDNEVLCYCGKTGCLEALVSATGLCNAASLVSWRPAGSDEEPTAEDIFKARKEKDPVAVTLVDQFLQFLRTGIDNYVNIYAPDMIILGGGVARGLEDDLHQLHNGSLLNPYKSYRTILAVSELHEKAGILGSAALFNN